MEVKSSTGCRCANDRDPAKRLVAAQDQIKVEVAVGSAHYGFHRIEDMPETPMISVRRAPPRGWSSTSGQRVRAVLPVIRAWDLADTPVFPVAPSAAMPWETICLPRDREHRPSWTSYQNNFPGWKFRGNLQGEKPDYVAERSGETPELSPRRRKEDAAPRTGHITSVAQKKKKKKKKKKGKAKEVTTLPIMAHRVRPHRGLAKLAKNVDSPGAKEETVQQYRDVLDKYIFNRFELRHNGRPGQHDRLRHNRGAAALRCDQRN